MSALALHHLNIWIAYFVGFTLTLLFKFSKAVYLGKKAGNLFIADYGNHRVRKVTPGGVISTVAGNGTAGFSGDGGPATSARLYNPSGVAIDASGNLFIADLNNNRIRKVTPDGIISTVAGNGASGYGGDGGLATSAQLNGPSGIAVNAGGNLFIVDYGNHCVRKVTPDGVISTVMGDGTTDFSGKDGPAISAWLYESCSVVVDRAGKPTKQIVIEWFFEPSLDNASSWTATIGGVWLLGSIYINRIVSLAGLTDLPLDTSIAFFLGTIFEVVVPNITKFIVSKFPVGK
jgi:hypothetical protein